MICESIPGTTLFQKESSCDTYDTKAQSKLKIILQSQIYMSLPTQPSFRKSLTEVKYLRRATKYQIC